MGRTVISGGKTFDVAGPQLKVGDRAPDFELISKTADGLKPVRLSDFAGNVLLLSVVPSLDTGVCAIQTKKFNERAQGFAPNIKVLTVSVDTPWAQARFGTENDISILIASDHMNTNFGLAYGTLVPAFRYEQRAIFIVDPTGEIKYVEYVPEIGQEPDYDKAIQAVQTLAE